MRKLYEILNFLWIQKRIVAAETICGNTVHIQMKNEEIELNIDAILDSVTKERAFDEYLAALVSGRSIRGHK